MTISAQETDLGFSVRGGEAEADEIEVAMMERLHDMSMSTDRTLASQGRLMKELFPPYLRWLMAEQERGSSAIEMSSAAVATTISMLATLIATITNHDPIRMAQGYPAMLALFKEQYERAQHRELGP